jgi:hypothetical protein
MSVKVKLSPVYFLGMAFLTALWGLGLILHFFVNNRVFPKVIDDEGITTRNGKRYLWTDLKDWERHRLVLGGSGGPRITGNITLFFSGGKVLIGSFPIDNLKEVLNFLTIKLNATAIPG